MPKEYKAALQKDAKSSINKGGSMLLELAIQNQSSKNKLENDEKRQKESLAERHR